MPKKMESVDCCEIACAWIREEAETPQRDSQIETHLTQEDEDDCGTYIRAAMLSALGSIHKHRLEMNFMEGARVLGDRMINELQRLDCKMLVERYHVLLRTYSETQGPLNNPDEDLFGSFIEPAMVQAMHFILPDGSVDDWPVKAELMRKCMMSELQQLDYQSLMEDCKSLQKHALV